MLALKRCIAIAGMALLASTGFAQRRSMPVPEENEREVARERAAFEVMRSADPKTGSLPDHIRSKELSFAAQSFVAQKSSSRTLAASNWHSRGPNGIGGRTRALGIDRANEHNILAGSTTGGMWRSTNDGSTWTRTTPLDYPPSVTCIAQDPRAGRGNGWYYGTGELGGNTGGWPLWLVSGSSPFGDYFGNGIYKSADSGATWSLLISTATDTVGKAVQPFNYVHRIAVDPSNASQDEVYAAVAGGIERSSDGGKSWTMVLGDRLGGGGFTDVSVTSTGVVYAFLGSLSLRTNSASVQGLFRSEDGVQWTNITPSDWRGSSWYSTIAIPRIDENIVYFGCDDTTGSSCLFKYTYRSGDGSGSGGEWEDRSLNTGNAGGTYEISVAPDNPDMVFVGGVYLVRSSDGFMDAANSTQLYPLHADMNAYAFYPSNPHRAIFGTDGGMYLSEDITEIVPDLRPLNDSYTTTQFYTVAIDHATRGSEFIVGGMQDNSTFLSLTDDATAPWVPLLGGDGAGCAIQDGATSLVVSYQQANMYRMAVDEFGSLIDYAPLKPTGLGTTLFFNPLLLDPANTDRLYIPSTSIWRCDDLNAIPYGSSAPPSGAWKELRRTRLTRVSTRVGVPVITSLAASTKPEGRLVYGTNDGRLFLLDPATSDDPVPVDIATDKGFPVDGFVSAIAIDAENADNIFIAVANYNVQSLFYSTNAGSTWTAVGGNLEEYPDGHGNGPACRAVGILHSGTGIVYLVGTTTGLYSTPDLTGGSVQWTLEAPTTIGNNIVNTLDTRSSDGLVVVGTCGNGVFSGNFAPRSSVADADAPSLTLEVSPNPATSEVKLHGVFHGQTALHATVSDQLGHRVESMALTANPKGEWSAAIDVHHLPAGVYYCELTDGVRSVVRQIVVIH